MKQKDSPKLPQFRNEAEMVTGELCSRRGRRTGKGGARVRGTT